MENSPFLSFYCFCIFVFQLVFYNAFEQVKVKNEELVAEYKANSTQTSSIAIAPGAYLEHVVESGQTISEIAQAYKVSQEEIMNVNKIKNASRIRVGQKLLIPKH